jgi:hypothetical protein
MPSEIPPELSVKLQRGQEHMMTLLVENTDQYFDKEPYEITFEADDNTGLCHTAYISFTEPLPPTFAMRIGEALYQLRSTLDHTVMMLSDVSPTSRNPEFVITDNRESFGGKGKINLSKRLDAIRAPEARSFIEAVQPFNERSGNPANNALWVLHELFMADKHRRLLLTQAASHGSRRIPIYPGVREISLTTGALLPDERNRAVLANMILTEPRRHIDLEIRPMLTVAFADEPVAQNRIALDVLDEILHFTWFVVSTLCKYLLGYVRTGSGDSINSANLGQAGASCAC